MITWADVDPEWYRLRWKIWDSFSQTWPSTFFRQTFFCWPLSGMLSFAGLQHFWTAGLRHPRLSKNTNDEDSREMTIEQYLHKIDLYRFTTAAVPLPLPVTRLVPSLDQGITQRLQNLIPEIRRKVDSHIKDQYTVDFCDTRKLDYPRGTSETLTLLIEIHRGNHQSSTWSKLGVELQAFLRLSNFSSIDVEIVDNSRAFVPSIFPQAAGTTAIEIYEDIRDQISALLFKKLENSWNGLTVFRFRRTGLVSTPSIVVYLEPFVRHNWSSLKEDIEAMFASKLSDEVRLDVEFLPGRISDTIGKAIPFEKDCFRPKMGSSIGVCGGQSSGTLGGFLNLEIGDRVYRGFLTNHHVIESDTIDNEKGYQYITSLNHVTNLQSRPGIQHPSPEDLQATRDTINADIKNLSIWEIELRKTNATREEVGEVPTKKFAQAHQKYLNAIRYHKEKLSQVNEKLPLTLGGTLVSSGHAINSEMGIVDWAFVAISESIQESLGQKFLNELPDTEHPQLQVQKYEVALGYAGDEPNSSHPLIPVDFGEIQKGKWYFKRGRTSGITAGMCNGTEMDICRSGLRYSEDGKAHDLAKQGHSTRELVILSFEKGKPGFGDPRAVQTPFSMLGDSGSLVIDQMGSICGLLYGSHWGLCGGDNERNDKGAGLVMSMEDVRKSVAQKTKMTDENGVEVHGELTLD